ncbi:MAG: LysM peptidoglycan-binding domain-containing protein [Thermoleophilia bacterium]
MSRAIGRVLAPFGALAFVMLVVSLLGGSDVLAGRVRPGSEAAPDTTRTTTIYLTQPTGGVEDPGPSGGAGPATTSAPGEGSGGDTDTTPSSTGEGPQAGSTDTAGAAEGTDSSADSSGGESTYTVKEGDTPYSIALAFGVSTSDLMNLNDIVDPTDLRIGTVLRIPAK